MARLPRPIEVIPLGSTGLPRIYGFVALLALVFGLLFVRPFFTTILFSILIAQAFNPVYKYVLRRTGKQWLAITLTLSTAIMIVLIPLIVIIAITADQIAQISAQISSGEIKLGQADIERIINTGVDRVNQVVDYVPGSGAANVNQDSIMEFIRSLGSKILSGFGTFLSSAGSAALDFITAVILSFFIIVALLRYQETIIRMIKQMSPFDESVTSVYVTKASNMTIAMIKGQLIIAILQGLASAASLWLVGVGYFWFFWVFLSFLSFIPLGAGIVTIPIGIVLMLTGHIPQGLFLIVFHMAGVSSIDNFLRPLLVPKSSHLNAALLLLAVFSGIALFGPIGVIYGPVLMIIFVTTLQMYAAVNSGQVRPKLPPTFEP